MFSGSHVAIVTPFRNGRVDERALGDLIEFQIANGTDGIVPCGTTGESATLSHEEHKLVVAFTIEAAKRRVPVIAGSGSNSTEEAIALTRHAKVAGADGALLITPYYNKPTQEGLYQHYKAIHDAVELPIVIYNIPGRCAVDMSVETMARLSKLPNIVGVKEASGNLVQVSEIVRTAEPGFRMISGDDALTLPMIGVGGVGVISVAANEAPGPMSKLVRLALENRWEEARKLNAHLLPLMQANFIETSPIPVKAALAMMGLIKEVYRLPLVPMSTENRARLEKVLYDVTLLKREKAPA